MRKTLSLLILFILSTGWTLTEANPTDEASQYSETGPQERLFEPNGLLTLADALALAVMHNPRLAAFSWDVRASQARALQAGLRPNPELEIEVEDAGGSGSRRGFEGAETTIQLSQLIERADKRTKRKNAAALDSQLANWDFKAKRLDVLTETTQAFIDVLSAQENFSLTEKLLELAQRQVLTVTQRVQAGKDVPLDQNKAEVIHSQISITHSQSGHELENARRQLASAWACQKPVFTKALGDFEDIGVVPPFDELAQKLSLNPDIARWSAELERSKAQEELEKAGRKQDFTVSAGMQRFNETDDNAIVFGISIPLPVFNRNQGNIAAARYNTRKVQQQQKAAVSEGHAMLSEAYQRLRSAYDQSREIKKSILEKSKAAFETAQESYLQGKSDYRTVLDAQRTFFDVQTEYVKALADLHKARADVERLTGLGQEHTKTGIEELKKENRTNE